jgi:hypothetical protein
MACIYNDLINTNKTYFGHKNQESTRVPRKGRQFRICGVMDSVLAFSAVDCRFESWSAQTKDYKTKLCFTAKHTALISKNKDLVTRNRDNVSECSGDV